MLNSKIPDMWISHTRLAVHGPCMANYTLVVFPNIFKKTD